MGFFCVFRVACIYLNLMLKNSLLKMLKKSNKTICCSLCRNRKIQSIHYLHTNGQIMTPQHNRQLFYTQITRLLHLCNNHWKPCAELSADERPLTWVKSCQCNSCSCAQGQGHLKANWGVCFNLLAPLQSYCWFAYALTPPACVSAFVEKKKMISLALCSNV